MKVLLCPRAKWPACYVIIPALLGSPSCPHFSLSSGVLLHLHSGQAIFVGPHWCNSRSSQMTDSRGFVAALFAVIVLPVSAAEKLEDSLPSSISNIWSTFSGPSLRERKALVEELKKKIWFTLLWSNWLSAVILHSSCSGISGIVVPVSRETSQTFTFFCFSSRSTVHLELKAFKFCWLPTSVSLERVFCHWLWRWRDSVQ